MTEAQLIAPHGGSLIVNLAAEAERANLIENDGLPAFGPLYHFPLQLPYLQEFGNASEGAKGHSHFNGVSRRRFTPL